MCWEWISWDLRVMVLLLSAYVLDAGDSVRIGG